MQAFGAKLAGLRAITGAQRRHWQAVLPAGPSLQFTGAAVARGRVEVVGQVDRVAGCIGGDAPAKLKQRYVIVVLQGQLQRAVCRALRGVIDDAQLQACQLRRFSTVQPRH